MSAIKRLSIFLVFASSTILSSSHSVDPTPDFPWHYEVKFSPEQFLAKCATDTECQSVLVRGALSAHERAWLTLYALRNHYAEERKENLKAHSYHTMARFTLSTDEAPMPTRATSFVSLSDMRAQQISELIERFGKLTRADRPNDKIKKWSYIWSALLLREWANHNSKHREKRLRDAYKQIENAIKLGSTRAAHIIAAQLIHDGVTPAGKTRAGALAMANEYLDTALKIPQQKKARRSLLQEPHHVPIVKQFARPPYLKDVSEVPSLGISVEDNDDDTTPTEDADVLSGFDFENFTIAQRPSFDDLSWRLTIFNAVGMPSDIYAIEGQSFSLQDVDAAGMNCFFNAMGLVRSVEIERLRAQAHNPIIRFMVANDIMSAAENPEELSYSVLNAINYDAWQTESEAISQVQNALDPNDDNSVVQAQLQARIQANDDALMGRALTLRAFLAYLNYLEQQGTMMATLRDATENGAANLGAIDAVAYLNNIGIRIFSADGSEKHRFIPENATQIKYLFHAGVHFQSLDLLTDDDDTQSEESDEEDVGPRSELCGKTREPRQINPAVNEMVFEAYLRHYQPIKEGRVTKVEFFRRAALAINERGGEHVSRERAENVFYNFMKKANTNLSALDIPDLVAQYRDGKSISDIVQSKKYENVRRSDIFEALSNNLSADEFHDQLNLTLSEAELTKEQTATLIKQTFSRLCDENDGRAPAVKQVADALKDRKISYKVVDRILKNSDLVATATLAKRCSISTANAIRDEYREIDPAFGERQTTKEHLAAKYRVAVTQITRIVANSTKQRSYASSSLIETEARRQMVQAEFEKLSLKEKKEPLMRIKDSLASQGIELSRNAVSKHLQTLGLYQPKSSSSRKADRKHDRDSASEHRGSMKHQRKQ